MKWQTFQMINVDKANDQNYWQRSIEVYEHFKKFRSEVIEAGLFTENSLTEVLLDFIAAPSGDRRALLKSMIFEAESFTFFQKWKLLRDLLEMYVGPLKLDPEEMKSLRKELHEIISLRNRFAHGSIFVDVSDFSVWMEYREGTKRWEKLEEPSLMAAKDTCDRIHSRLWEIHEAIAALGYILPVIDAYASQETSCRN